jgi:perosamine synthetase
VIRIPANEPLLDGSEEALLVQCIRDGWISGEGPVVARFEEEFAARVGRGYGVAVTNGSAALEVAVAALGIGVGDEVIIPTFTIISCAAAVVRAGAIPVVVDCDPATWNMVPEQVAASVTARTRAVMMVHTYGLPADADAIMQVAQRHGLAVIEDAAQMHGQVCRGRPCGSFGEISTFSFYANKHVTCGEGGMVVTDNCALATRCRSLRNLCFKTDRRFVHDELGWNYRMSSMQAAVGIGQLRRLDDTIARKRRIGERYSALLAATPGLQLPLPRTELADNNWWAFGVVLGDDTGMDATELARLLAERGIGTRPFFWPMHEQPVFRSRGLFQGVSCPVAERVARRGLCLPSGVALTDQQVDDVTGALYDILAGPAGP